MSNGAIGLQARPPLMLALGALDPMEQSHLQIALRVVSSKMAVPCTTVMEDRGDLVFSASPVPMTMRITSAFGHRDVERPVRLVPLSDALSELIDGILASENGGSTAAAPVAAATRSTPSADTPVAGTAQVAHAAVSGNGRTLLSLLLARIEKGPLKIVLDDDTEVFVDAYYHSAWSATDPARLADGRLLRPTRHVMQATPTEMTDATRHHRVAVEQLCWMGLPQPDNSAMVGRWSEDPQGIVRLTTWPNLSLQPDYSKWLELLAALRARPRTIEELQRIAPGFGIDAERLRYGIAMLSLFGHASHTRTPASAAEVVVAPESSVFKQDGAPERAGLFGRLRSRLRSMVG